MVFLGRREKDRIRGSIRAVGNMVLAHRSGHLPEKTRCTCATREKEAKQDSV